MGLLQNREGLIDKGNFNTKQKAMYSVDRKIKTCES